MKVGSIKKSLNILTHNKIVLYILLAYSFYILLSYLGQNNLGGIVLFLLIGLGSTHFTKNMIYVLLLAICATSLLVNMGFLRLFGIREGMTGEDGESSEETTEATDESSVVGQPSNLSENTHSAGISKPSMAPLSPSMVSDDEPTDEFPSA